MKKFVISLGFAGLVFGLDFTPSPIFFVSNAQIQNIRDNLQTEVTLEVRKQPVYERLYSREVLLKATRNFKIHWQREFEKLYQKERTYERQWKEIWVRYMPSGRAELQSKQLVGVKYLGERTKYLGTRLRSTKYLGAEYVGTTYTKVGENLKYLGTRYKHTCYTINGKPEGCW